MDPVKEHLSLDQMIQYQLVGRGIHDQRVIEAMRAVPRPLFFPAEGRDDAFADSAAPIGHGQTISQPYIVALMSQTLSVEPGHRVLEIGTGSGYQTAILARIAREVFTIERVKPLLDQAWDRIMGLGMRNVHFRLGDGSLGWKEEAPFDRIMVTAGAPRMLEELFLTQLADGGMGILPVGQQGQQSLMSVRRAGGKLETQSVLPVSFVKLIGEAGWREDVGTK